MLGVGDCKEVGVTVLLIGIKVNFPFEFKWNFNALMSSSRANCDPLRRISGSVD